MDHSSWAYCSYWAVTLGSLTCGEGGNLSTRDLDFIYVSSAGRIGCELLHPAQPTDAPSNEEAPGPISIPQGSRGVKRGISVKYIIIVYLTFKYSNFIGVPAYGITTTQLVHILEIVVHKFISRIPWYTRAVNKETNELMCSSDNVDVIQSPSSVNNHYHTWPHICSTCLTEYDYHTWPQICSICLTEYHYHTWTEICSIGLTEYYYHTWPQICSICLTEYHYHTWPQICSICLVVRPLFTCLSLITQYEYNFDRI